MGNPHGFMKFDRALPPLRKVEERIQDFKELYQHESSDFIEIQSARCMDCGIPFCHSACPLGNLIPEFNDAVYQKDWHEAYEILISTNNFPEFTGRICPAPCEKACVLGINSDEVAIEFIEKSIIEMAFDKDWVKPLNPIRTGKRVAIIGSGPAGLAAADQANKSGHSVTVYEKNDAIGGLLRYGIPDFKLEKAIIDRRVKMMEKSGIVFKTNEHIGKTRDVNSLLDENDALILCCGSSVPRDLNIPGRGCQDVHFAMPFLTEANKYVAHDSQFDFSISIKDKHIVVIGGGDTGADCVGSSNRLGAASVTQLELMFKPSDVRTENDPWPLWPMTLKTSSSHEEGCERIWSIVTKSFIQDENERLFGLEISEVQWDKNENGQFNFIEKAGSSRILKADVVFLAMGFLHPDHSDVIKILGLETDEKGNVTSKNHQTNLEKVFVAGDMHMGQSLVVWAISEGRKVAEQVDVYLGK